MNEPIRTLLVEDDAVAAELTLALVQGAPGPRLVVRTCSTLAAAAAALRTERWDLVLLDLSLPDAIGVETIRRTAEVAPDVPIVVLTGHDDEAAAVEAVREGAQDYLVKGRFDGDLLMRAVRYAIERRRAAVALRCSEARLTAVFDHLPEGVLLLDADGRLLLINPKARECLPLLTDRPPAVGDLVKSLGGFGLEELLRKGGEGGWHEVVEDATIPRTFEVRAGRLSRGPAGNLLLVVRDVTDARDLQRQVGTQQRLAAVGELAAGVAHDFNNVLQVIIGASELLADTPELDPVARERAAFISRQGQHAARVIHQILTFGRRSVLERRHFDLGPFVAEMFDVLRRGISEDIVLDVQVPPGAYPIHGDPTQLQQILTNLAVNARDAMPAGGTLTVALSLLDVADGAPAPRPDMRPGPWAVIEVTDTGVGIVPGVLPRVFEPFFTTKETGAGTGLGLSQAYGAAEQHGGFIDVRSRPGAGAAFRVLLPLETAPVDVAESAPRPPPDRSGRQRTVLVVEDEDDVRRLVADILAHLGHHAITARDGSEGLALYQKNRGKVDLVITDKTMPEMGGLELARRLSEEDPEVRVLILTGYLVADRERASLENRAVFGWVQKPIEIDHLARVVQAAFGGAAPP